MPRHRAVVTVVTIIALMAALTACAPDAHFGTITPNRLICKLGGFDQSLALAPDFHIDRVGHDAYLSDGTFKTEFNRQAADITKFSKCSGTKTVGRVEYKLRRLEVGSNRGQGAKILMWVVLILPSLGFSSIYPLTEQRWLTLELDAQIFVGKRLIWRGEFASKLEVAALMKESEGAGLYLSQLMTKAQERAIAELSVLLPAGTVAQ